MRRPLGEDRYTYNRIQWFSYFERRESALSATWVLIRGRAYESLLAGFDGSARRSSRAQRGKSALFACGAAAAARAVSRTALRAWLPAA